MLSSFKTDLTMMRGRALNVIFRVSFESDQPSLSVMIIGCIKRQGGMQMKVQEKEMNMNGLKKCFATHKNLLAV